MINWRIMPFARIAIVFMLGIFLADKSNIISASSAFFISLVVLCIYFIIRHFKLFDYWRGHVLSGLLLLFFFILGYVKYKTNVVDISEDYFAKQWNSESVLIGVVKEIPKVRTSAKTQIELKEICNNNVCRKAHGTVMAYFTKEDEKAISYMPGDKISMQGKIRPVKHAGNPNSFDFKSFLKYRHILHQIFIKEGSHNFIAAKQMSWINNLAFGLRQRLLDVFKKYIHDPAELGVVSALVLGYNNAVPDDLYQAFSDSGAVHVLAVSGMHVGIVATFLLFFLNRIKLDGNRGKVLKLISLLAVVWMFSLVTGAAPAVMRSAVMFTMIWVGKYWFDYQNLFNILAASALGMLFFDPYLLFHASFQFSYTAMLSLMFFQPYISKLLIIKNKALSFIWNMTSSAISAQILVFPITIYFFHKFPLYFILSGVVAVFTGILALYLGLILLVVEFIFEPLNIVISKFFQWSSTLFIESVQWVKNLPGASIDGLWMSDAEFILIYLILILLMIYLSTRSFKLVYLMSTFCALYLYFFVEKKIDSRHYLGMTVYDSFNTTLLDFFDGNKLYYFTSDTLTDNDMKFICYNNRYYRDAHELIPIKMNADFESLRIKKEGPLIRMKNKIVYIAEGEIDTNLLKTSNYIVALESTKWTYTSKKLLENKCFVIDKSSKRNITYQIKKYCELPKCKIHDVNVQGAFDLAINEEI